MHSIASPNVSKIGEPKGRRIFGKRITYVWLKDKGYQLRPRLAPDWTPSWKGTSKYYRDCEVGLRLRYSQICDAIHVPTGAGVALKKVDKKDHPFGEKIHRFIASELMVSDPRNRCVPLLEVLTPPDDNPDTRILVMPLLRPFDSPIFDTFGEAVECIRQLFEGLHFMHENHVAHCSRVFYAGSSYLTHIRGYKGFDFLKPLIDDIVQDDPSKRPNVDEVVRGFQLIADGLSSWKLRSRTSWRHANIFEDVAHAFSHWRRRFIFVVKGTPPIARPSVNPDP